MPDLDPSPKSPDVAAAPPSERRGWVLPVAAVAVVALLCGTLIYAIHTMQRVSRDTAGGMRDIGSAMMDRAEKAAEAVTRLAGDLMRGETNVTVNSYIRGLQGTNRLQFATLSDTLLLHVEEKKLTSNVEVLVRAQAEYVYYIDLEKPWHFVMVDDTTLQVYVPEIEYNTPAVKFADREEWVLKKDAWRDEEKVLKDTERRLQLEAGISARRHIPEVRAEARIQVETFVRQWVVTTYGSDELLTVTVFFPGEGEPPLPPIPPEPGSSSEPGAPGSR